MKLYRTRDGTVVESSGHYFRVPDMTWSHIVSRDDALALLAKRIAANQLPAADQPHGPLAPVEDQEVWAAGVTYLRSRVARMEESKSAGGGDFYDRVYAAERPELFFKSLPRRVVGPGGNVRIRKDSQWNVPEPELTLMVSSTGKIIGYTIGNDMSSRDIEGENPLYLPQAKVYDGACALGPCIYLTDKPLPKETKIQIRIRRGGAEAFAGETAISQIKRDLSSLAEYLYRESAYPSGCLLMTGTGVVPPDSFTLQSGDEIAITIDPIGTLTNRVE